VHEPTLEHPDQPLYIDAAGVVRFHPNRIVRLMVELLAQHGIDLNELHVRCPADHDRTEDVEADAAGDEGDLGDFSRDWEQVNQLMGYSVSGYGDLSYIRREVVDRCDEAASALIKAKKGVR